MSSSAKFPGSNDSGWTNSNNGHADDGSYATAAPGKNAIVYAYYYNFNFGIPSNATIGTITIEAQYKVDTTASIATFYMRAYKGTTAMGTEYSDTAEPTSDATRTHTSNGTWTVSELNDNTTSGFRIRVGAGRGNSTTAVTFSLDYVKATVEYTVTTSKSLTGNGKASGIITRSVSVTKSCSNKVSGTKKTTINVTKSGSAKITGTARRVINKAVAAVTAKVTGTIEKSKVYLKTVTASAKAAASKIITTTKILIEHLTASGTARRSTTKSLIDTVSTAGTNTKRANKALTSGVDSSGSRTAATNKTLADSLSISGRAVKSATKTLLKTVLAAGSIVKEWTSGATVLYKTLTATAKTGGNLTKSVTKTLIVTITSAATAIKTATKTLTTNISVFGSNLPWMVVVTIYYKTLTAGINAAGVIGRYILKRLAGGIDLSGIANRMYLLLTTVQRTKTLTKATRTLTASTTTRTLTLSITTRTLTLEVEGSNVAYTGDTIRLKASFYNFAGALADVTSPTLKIYDGKGTLLNTYTPSKETTGIYYYDYTIPAIYSDPLVYEFSGALEGSTILARSTIEREWV